MFSIRVGRHEETNGLFFLRRGANTGRTDSPFSLSCFHQTEAHPFIANPAIKPGSQGFWECVEQTLLFLFTFSLSPPFLSQTTHTSSSLSPSSSSSVLPSLPPPPSTPKTPPVPKDQEPKPNSGRLTNESLGSRSPNVPSLQQRR